jgi:hypothetical protein
MLGFTMFCEETKNAERRTEEVRSSGNASDLYSKSSHSNSGRDTGYLDSVLSWFSSVPPGNDVIILSRF